MWGYPSAVLKSVEATVKTCQFNRLLVLGDLIRTHKAELKL